MQKAPPPALRHVLQAPRSMHFRCERIILRAPGTLAIRPNMVIHRLMKGVVMAADGKRSAKAMGARLAVLYARFRPYCRPS